VDATAIDAVTAEFLSRPLSAIVATLGEDGRPSQSVVWFVPDGDTLWFSTRPSSVKVRHLRRDPRLSMLVIAADGGAYVRIEGRATLDEVVHDDARLALISRYVGAEAAPGWMAGHPLPSPNTLVRMHPDRLVGYGLG
jgi:PPOX class probable F420-dependent enzyme